MSSVTFPECSHVSMPPSITFFRQGSGVRKANPFGQLNRSSCHSFSTQFSRVSPLECAAFVGSHNRLTVEGAANPRKSGEKISHSLGHEGGYRAAEKSLPWLFEQLPLRTPWPFFYSFTGQLVRSLTREESTI